MVLAQLLCDELILEGHWADYIDPCSGLPVSDQDMHFWTELRFCQIFSASFLWNIIMFNNCLTFTPSLTSDA